MGNGKLGWKVEGAKAQYNVRLAQLSAEEEEAVLGICALFGERAQKKEIEGEKQAMECIGEICASYCEANSIELDAQQQKYLPKAAFLHTYGNCFLDEMLADCKLEEIACIGLGKPLFVYCRGEGWKRTNCKFEDAHTFVASVNKLARQSGKRVSMQTPRINVALRDGSRMHAAVPPVCDYALTIRKFAAQPLCAHELAACKTASFESLAFLWTAMQAEISILVAGNTASGKTTTLNALFSFVPRSERIIIVEDTAEINLPHAHALRMLSSEEAGIEMGGIIRDTLRMRPDRLIVGEMRSPKEVEAFMETVLSGQGKGSYGTFHAQSCPDALNRLRMLGAMPSDMPSIGIVVVQRRMENYDMRARKGEQVRKVVEISEISLDKAGMPQCVQIFAMQNKALLRTKNPSVSLVKIAECFGCSQQALEKELGKREGLLREMGKRRISFGDAFEKVQKFMLQ